MSPRRVFFSPRWRAQGHPRQAGFTLLELMIGLVLGLLSTLAITQIMTSFEGRKRTTMAGADAQVNAGLALSMLRQSVQMAGYGFASFDGSLGCSLSAQYNGAAITGFPAVLAPVSISDGGANSAPDSIRILHSSKTSFSVPLQLASPGYTAGDLSMPVASVSGVLQGDLMVAIPKTVGQPCSVFQATAAPATPTGSNPYTVEKLDNAWNATGFPTLSYGIDALLANLGSLVDTTYGVNQTTGHLTANSFVLSSTYAPSYSGAQNMFGNVVNLQAYYGKDTNADGAVDRWDTSTPTTNDGWKQVLALRVALVMRSDQFEKAEKDSANNKVYVTAANLLWDVGANTNIVDSNATIASCGTSKCVTIKIDGLTNWQNYRYRIVDTVIPLRNVIWKS